MKKVVDKIDAVVAGKAFFLLLGIILLCGLTFRVAYLDADPPAGITKSQDFSTDPPQYNYFAKNSVDHGSANPYGDPRFAQWQKSSQNFLALIVFNLFGTGRAAENGVAVVFNLAAILLLALAIKNFGSRLAALLFAAFACFDFTMLWFGRTPFLEGAQNFWICLSVYLFSKGPAKSLFYIFAGIACAAAAFFGKMIALFMAGVFLVVFLMKYLNDNETKKAALKNAIWFGGGYLFTAIVYLVAVYLPSRSQVAGYLTEQAFGLYGAPKALDSPNDFLYQLMTLLWDAQFFTKMPIITILAFIGGAGILTWFAVAQSRDKKLFGDFNTGWLLVLVWFGAGYVALFPWNYRPLRYQTTIMFPAFALAAIALAYMIEFLKSARPQAKKAVERTVRLPVLLASWGLWLLPLIALIALTLTVKDGAPTSQPFIGKSPFAAGMIFIAVGAVIAFAYTALAASFRKAASFGVIIAGVLVVVVLGLNIANFVTWTGRRQYSLVSADRDLAAILGKGAVITGPYAPAFTLENKFGAVIHMFGVVNVDKDFFSKYPMTHIAMDEGNEKFAREQYPDLMNRAKFVTRYFARGVPVKVYNIVDASPNAAIKSYVPTDYEIAQSYIAANRADSAEFYMRRYLDSGIPNFSANMYVGDALNSQDNWERAIEYYRKVQEFSRGDAQSAIAIANCFLSLGGAQTNAAYFDSALVYFKKVRGLYRNDPRLENTINQLERRKQ
ncbi:MAG: tetratricopeptide repeat protein [Candidatus Zixiibacteriota bacterium]